jgi:hypothetical protein
LQVVPYTGGPAAALTDVVGGRVPFIIEGYSGLAGAIQAHSLTVLAVASAHRLPEFPNATRAFFTQMAVSTIRMAAIRKPSSTHVLRCSEVLQQSVALGHVWTAPWQELSDAAAALVGCGHVSGLLMRPWWPLALMLLADRVPIVSTHLEVR